jgi:hypothetical protein
MVHYGREMDRQMLKYVLLIPLTYNDGTSVPQSVRDRLLDEIYLLASGYTIAGTVSGAFQMTDGGKKIDELLEVWICLSEDAVSELKTLVRRFARELGQESMYLERTGGNVELVTPEPDDDDLEEDSDE